MSQTGVYRTLVCTDQSAYCSTPKRHSGMSDQKPSPEPILPDPPDLLNEDVGRRWTAQGVWEAVAPKTVLAKSEVGKRVSVVKMVRAIVLYCQA